MTQGYIYKLVCKDENIKDTYIGSCENMRIRYNQHKRNCYNNKQKKHYNQTVYKFIRNNGGFENWIMETIEICECRDTRHLKTVEQFYIDVHGGVDFLLNGIDAVMDNEQRKEKQKISHQHHRHRNIDTKKYYCECCDHAFISNYQLQRHYNTKKHKEKC